VVSVEVDSTLVPPGEDTHAEDAWTLKERIRQREGVLKQRRSFFEDAYRRSEVHCYHVDGDLAGFAAVRRDGYILFLATAPEYRGRGFGKRLVADVADQHSVVTCHARTTNDDALAFYEHIGFEIQRRIDSYYEDGGDAYYLKLGESAGLTEKLSRLVGR
jgi:ribosomal protein S18 acetylase RimI-like enzyme